MEEGASERSGFWPIITPPNSDVVFVSDLIEEEFPPVHRDSHPIDWPATLR